jgi:hypothetical protein
MAIAFDAATDGGNNGGTTNSLTFSHTCTGSNLILFVHFQGDAIGGADDITGVTYNGTSLTLALKTGLGNNRFSYVYYLLSPSTGAHNVVISCTANHYIIGTAASYTGAAQTTPDNTAVGGSVNASDLTCTTSITTVADNCWVFLGETSYSDQNAPVAGTNTVRRTYGVAFGEPGTFDSGGVVHPAGSLSMTTTLVSNNVNIYIIHIMVSFAPFVASAPVARSLIVGQAIQRGANW